MLRPVAQPIPSREPSPFPPSAIDRVDVSKTDDQFQPLTWEDVKRRIAENRLETLKRRPSDIRKYREWSSGVRLKHGSVLNFVLKNRLQWPLSSNTTPETGPVFEFESPIPFNDSRDYRILPNDWPYGFEPGITHLIVWLKTRLQSEPVIGDITPVARQQVEDFVQWKFRDRVKDLSDPHDRILWFKNWTSIQSVPGVDHVHVLVRDVPEDIIKEWIEEDHSIENAADNQ